MGELKMGRIAIVGHGKMGKQVEEVLKERGEEYLIIDPNVEGGASWDEAIAWDSIDTAICFTTPAAGYETTERLLKKGIDTIVGTTKFYMNGTEPNTEMLDNLGALARMNNCRMAYAPNFATGMNLAFGAVEYLARLAAKNGFEPGIIEIHHDAKEDVSGTAMKMFAKILMDAYPGKTVIKCDGNNTPLKHNEISLGVLRVGNVPGTHTLWFESKHERVTVTHEAKDRRVFAACAVDAVYKLQGKEEGLYTLSDLL